MWVAPSRQRDLFEQLCGESSVATADQLLRMVAALGAGYGPLVEATHAMQRAADAPAMDKAFHVLRVTRRARQYVKNSGQELEERCEALRQRLLLRRGSGGGSEHKRLRKEAFRCALLVEGVRITVAACLGWIAGKGLATRALAFEAAEWKRVEAAFAAMRLSLFEMYHGALPQQLQVAPELVAPCRRASSFFADDTFLVPAHQVQSLLVTLSQFVAPVGSFAMSSVTLDTLPELEDYKQVCSGSGISISRIWWKGDDASALMMERFMLNDDSGEIEREQCAVARQDLSAFLLGGEDAIARHIVAGQRVPVAGARFTRHVFVDSAGFVNVNVDVGMSFAVLTGSWQDDRMFESPEAYAFPHAIVTVQIGGRVREELPWLKKLYKAPELGCFQPDFSAVTACVACCYGDVSYPMNPVPCSALEALKTRGREQRDLQRQAKSYSAEEQARNKVLFTSTEAVLDPKNYWTAERTLHSWLHTSIFLALNSASLYGATNLTTKIGGVVVAGAAICLALYALVRWVWRSRSLRSSNQSLDAFVDRVAPLFAVLLVVVLLATSIGARIAENNNIASE